MPSRGRIQRIIKALYVEAAVEAKELTAAVSDFGSVPLCASCGRRSPRFNIGGARRCLPCTLRFRPLLRRSLLTALFVGTVLTAINQGNLILSGDLSAALLWKVPLTYCVPFCVATWGALINSRSLGGA